jgi:GH24 family phage-related lysozyme (muramidase)
MAHDGTSHPDLPNASGITTPVPTPLPNAPGLTSSLAENLRVAAIDPDAAGALAALDGVPPCPDIAGIILKEFPNIKVVVDLLAAGIGAAEGIYAKTQAQDPTSLTDQAKSAFTDAYTKTELAVINAARDLKGAAEEIAAEAKQAVYDEIGKIGQLYEAIAKGVLDIGTAIENLDEAAIAAMEAQFPGFKNAIECLKGGPEGSPVREAAGEGAKAQITTPADESPAADKNPTSVLGEEDLNLALISIPETSEIITARAIIIGFESFESKAYLDPATRNISLSAYRVGYGSDTLTAEDGTVTPVTQDSITTVAASERDIERRLTTEFGPRARNNVGAQYYDALPNQAKAALISLTYNYGNVLFLKDAVATDDLETIAKAIEVLPDNPGRRKQEANLVRNALRTQKVFTKEYPHVFTDPDDSTLKYYVYPGNSVYNTNSDKDPVALLELASTFPKKDLTQLPVMINPTTINSSTSEELVGPPEADLPEEPKDTFKELDDLIEATGLEQGSIIITTRGPVPANLNDRSIDVTPREGEFEDSASTTGVDDFGRDVTTTYGSTRSWDPVNGWSDA